jgi:hypothetical protein
MVFYVKLSYLCSIYNILSVFPGGGGGDKLKQKLEGWVQGIKVWEPLD